MMLMIWKGVSSHQTELLSPVWGKIALCLVKYQAEWWPCAITEDVIVRLTLFT